MRNHFFIILLAIVWCWTCQATWAGDNEDNTLIHLQAACEEARSLARYEQLDSLSARLLHRARTLNNIHYESYALFYSGLSKLFLGNTPAVLPTLQLAYDKAQDDDNDSVKALVYNAQGIYHAMVDNNSFLAQQFFFRSLDHAEKAGYEQLKGRVYGNLIILTQSDRDTTGLENARKIYDYGHQNNDFEQTFMGAYYMAMYHNLRGELQEAEKYLRESLQLFEKYRYDDVAAVYILYSKVRQQQGDMTAALNMAQKAIMLAQNYHQAGLLPDAYLQYATLLNDSGQYKESNEMAKKAIEVADEASNRSKLVQCFELIAKNYTAMGQKDGAMSYLLKANHSLDTLVTVNMDRLLHERSIMQEMDKHEQEAATRQQQVKTQRRINIILFSALAILAALLSVITMLYRRRNKLYKHIVSQNSKAAVQQMEQQQRIDELTAQVETLSAADESKMPTDKKNDTDSQETANKRKALTEDEVRAREIYDRLCHLMLKDRVYADPQLNRERLAEMLGTNRTYLSIIIKEKSGMNYAQFINYYRINEAIRLLSDKEMASSPLKQIWRDLGFNSPATFYKLFQQAVGITPSVYRKQVMNLEE